MNTRIPEKSRKQQIILSARSLLAKRGESGFSLREVAKEVGIKLASLQYHFPTRAELVEAILAHTIDVYLKELEALPVIAGANPEDTLRTVLRWFTGTQAIGDEDVRLEVHLWAMALNDPLVLASLARYHRLYLEKIAELIANARPDIDAAEVKRRAVAIACLQEGSYLFLSNEAIALSQTEILDQVYKTSVAIALE